MGYTPVRTVLHDTENPWRYLASSYILASEKKDEMQTHKWKQSGMIHT